MEYSRSGNRERYDAASWKRRDALASLVISECIENKGRYMDDIINGIWCICEETFWGIPAHGYMMKREDPLPDTNDHVIELFSAETAALLAWTSYLLKTKLDQISTMVCDRIELEVKKRVLDPYINRDFWWMGFNQETMLNNWNPWCNSNCLSAFLLLEGDPVCREAAVKRVMKSLDCYLQRIHPDGGCEEGPKYWIYAGGALLDCLELLYGVSDGDIDVYQDPKIKQIGRYIYKAFINDSYYVNFADSSAKVHIPAELVYRYGLRIKDNKLCGLGAMALKTKQEASTRFEFSSMFRLLPALFNYTEVERYNGESPFIQDAWFAGTQLMIAREQANTSKGLYVAAKGGHNDESHNHNDIGHFIVYCNGSPMIIDPGALTYTSKSFFSERYTLWAMQSDYHNLPNVNGVQQMDGKQYRATDVEYYRAHETARLSMNIAEAYPESSMIKSWIRTVSLVRGPSPYVEIKDNFQLHQWIGPITFYLMTPCLPKQDGAERLVLQDENNNKIFVQYQSEKYRSSTEIISLDDEVMRDGWGNQIYRIHFRAISKESQSESIIRISKE